MSLSKSGILGTFLLAGSFALGVPKIASAQNPTETRQGQNRIYSSDHCLSATGEGVYLKNFCHDLTLSPDSRINLNTMFNFSAISGEVSYDVMTGREGIEYGLRFLRQGTQNPEKRASINYLENLLQNTPESDPGSVSLLRKAVGDGILDQNDSLFMNNQPRIHEGWYTFLAKSPGVTEYAPNSIPVFVHIKNQIPAPTLAQASIPTPPETVYVQPSQPIPTPTPTPVPAEPMPVPRQRPERAMFYGGPEFFYNTDKEIGTGGFLGIQTRHVPGLGFELAGSYAAQRGNPFAMETRTSVVDRATQTIGPGTTKQRTDQITNSGNETGMYELGARATFSPATWLDLIAGAGTRVVDRKKRIDETSVISFERNGAPLGTPQTIGNFLEDQVNGSGFSLNLGARFNINERLNASTYYNRAGRLNRMKFGLGIKIY